MKKITIIFAIGLMIQQTAFSQGTVYLSNLSQSPDGNTAVGNDSWLAANFHTGTNPSGYALDSIQLGMTNATGSPSGFTAMIYSAIVGAGVNPGTNLETLNGSADPSTTGIYTYTDASNLMLLPNTHYFIVLTAGTAISNGSYEWDVMNTASYNTSDSWIGSVTLISNNGSSWQTLPTYPNMDFSAFAITATPAPEPSSLVLFGLGSLFFIRHHRKAKAV